MMSMVAVAFGPSSNVSATSPNCAVPVGDATAEPVRAGCLGPNVHAEPHDPDEQDRRRGARPPAFPEPVVPAGRQAETGAEEHRQDQGSCEVAALEHQPTGADGNDDSRDADGSRPVGAVRGERARDQDRPDLEHAEHAMRRVAAHGDPHERGGDHQDRGRHDDRVAVGGRGGRWRGLHESSLRFRLAWHVHARCRGEQAALVSGKLGR